MRHLIYWLLLVPALAAAESTTQPCDHARAIYPTIAAKSVSSEFAQSGDKCTISWTPKPGETVTFVDQEAAHSAIRAELGALEDKIDSGSNLTNAEMRRAIKMLLVLLRLSKNG